MDCSKVNHFRVVCKSVRHKAVHKLEQEINKNTEEDRQIDTVNIKLINSDAKTPRVIAKLKTSSCQKSVKISYKVDTDSNSNILSFCIYKILFLRSTKILLSELKVVILS